MYKWEGGAGPIDVYNVAVEKVCMMSSDVVGSDVAAMSIQLTSVLKDETLIELTVRL